MRYQVRPIADENCDSLCGDDQILLETDDLAVAVREAGLAAYPWGGGVLDTQTGLIDVGEGFGEPLSYQPDAGQQEAKS